MKNAKRIAAIAAGLALTFSAMSTVFADDDTTATVTKTTTADKKDYGSLSYTTSTFVYEGVAVGDYPVISGVGSLNDKITADIKEFLITSLDTTEGIDATVSNSVSDGDDGVYSTITVTTVANSTSGLNKVEQVKTYYVDKSSNTEVSEDAYKAGLEALTAAEEEKNDDATAPTTDDKELTTEQVNEILNRLTPLASTLKTLGYKYVAEGSGNVGDAKTFTWVGASGKVNVYDPDKNLSVITVGQSKYKANGKDTDLGVRAENQNGSVYVPASYFNQILNLDVNLDGDEITSFSVPNAE
ncbi:hypothetical protein AGMMS49975_07310 [Clostridia bacterium]|nr:hypothetical protein AGMMS49975_07310 [Clostridia bacterium]